VVAASYFLFRSTLCLGATLHASHEDGNAVFQV
jgi:hypothetical protein